MPKTTIKDQFANMGLISCVESAANTLTFKKLETGIAMFEKVAWVINRIEYYITNTLASQFNGDGDSIAFALTATDQMTSMELSNAAVIDWNEVLRQDWGTAGNADLYIKPIVKDFNQMPGGGIIVTPNPIYLGVKGTGLVAVATVKARFWYSTLEMAPDQYWELVEARRIISST